MLWHSPDFDTCSFQKWNAQWDAIELPGRWSPTESLSSVSNGSAGIGGAQQRTAPWNEIGARHGSAW